MSSIRSALKGYVDAVWDWFSDGPGSTPVKQYYKLVTIALLTTTIMAQIPLPKWRAPKNTPLQVWVTNRESEATAAVHAVGFFRGVVNISP